MPSPASPLPQSPPVLDFAALFEASPNPYMVLDRELRYVAANRAYLHVAASRLEDLLGRHLFDAFPHDPADPNNAPARLLRASFERVLRERKPDVLALIPYRVPRHTPGGIVTEERFWSATHTPLLDAQGEVAFILQHTEDVTELQRLKQASAAAQGEPPAPARVLPLVEAGVLSRAQVVQEAHRLVEAQRRELLELFQQAPGFVAFLRGREHVFELSNAAYQQLTGRKELLGKRVRDALPEVTGQGFVALLDRVFDTGEPFVGRAVRVELQRGGDALQTRYVDFMYQPIRGADGQVSGILVQGQDNTERRLAEVERERLLRDLSEAVRLRDEFLSVASHELKTPLTPLSLHLARLERELREAQGEAADGARARELRSLAVAQRQVRKLTALVEDLLDVSQLGAGQLRLEPRALDLCALVRGVAERLEGEARRAGCHLELSTPERLQGDFDPLRVEQVLTHLLSNALKYGPGQPVQLGVEPLEAGRVRLRVQDRGIGIAPDVLPRIFGKFERGVSERHYGGLGLGLYVTRKLVEAMGGSVGAHSAPGQGATFTVELPLHAPPAPPAPPPGGALAPEGGFEQQLVGIVSHDLRNPLSAIHLVAANLLRHEGLDERTARGLTRIQRSTGRALRLVRDLLDFTQVRLGQGIRLQCSPVDLHALARQGLVDVQSAFPERELRLVCEGDAQGTWDADRLTQVLVNLTSNALTFSPPDSAVTVRTWGEPAHVGLSVHNAGAPIPQELLPRLFEPMQRGAREGERGSVGLGLFIVRQLVHAHGGRVEVESSAGHGTRFTVLLPREASAPDA